MLGAALISHASEDAAVAHRVVEVLESAGVDCWIAPRDIVPGSDYTHAILDGIAGCAPDAIAEYAQEGLDDSEPQVQKAAMNWAPDTPALRHRLAELRDDPLAAELWEAATSRLARQAIG